jgi:hypothetical protein
MAENSSGKIYCKTLFRKGLLCLKLEASEKWCGFLSPQGVHHGLVNYINSKAKFRHLKTCKWTLRQVFICLRPPLLLGFCLEWSSNFVGSESGQIQNVKLLQNMVSNRTQHPPPPPSHTLPVWTVLWHRKGEKGGRVEPERRLEGQQFTKLGRKYQHDWLFLQSISLLYTTYFYRSIFLDDDILLWCLYC